MPRSIDLNDVRLLLQVVEHGNFTTASTATGIPKSTISQRVAALEQEWGVGLVRRTPRRFSLTEAGELLLPHARTLEDVAQRMEASLMQHGDGAKGTLRLSCPVALLQSALPTLLQRLLALHEHASFSIETTDCAVDPVAAGIDLAIRHHVEPLKDSSLLQRVVASLPWAVVASPQWIEANPVPDSPIEIPASALLAVAGIANSRAWTFTRGEKEQAFAQPPRLLSSDMLTLRTLALGGAGVVCLPTFLLQRDLCVGRLVSLLPDWRLPQSTISALTPPGVRSTPLAKLFSEPILCS